MDPDSGRALVEQFDEHHLDLGESRPGKDSLDIHSSSGRKLVGEGAGHHTNVEEERAGGIVLTFIGKTEWVDGYGAHSESVKTVIHWRMESQAGARFGWMTGRASRMMPCCCGPVHTGQAGPNL